jgi:hypothetical protein
MFVRYRLPIEDSILEAEPVRPQDSTLLFPQSSNPIMSTLAFLSMALDPRVSASGARAALLELTKPASGTEQNADAQPVDAQPVSEAQGTAESSESTSKTQGPTQTDEARTTSEPTKQSDAADVQTTPPRSESAKNDADKVCAS